MGKYRKLCEAQEKTIKELSSTSSQDMCSQETVQQQADEIQSLKKSLSALKRQYTMLLRKNENAPVNDEPATNNKQQKKKPVKKESGWYSDEETEDTISPHPKAKKANTEGKGTARYPKNRKKNTYSEEEEAEETEDLLPPMSKKSRSSTSHHGQNTKRKNKSDIVSEEEVAEEEEMLPRNNINSSKSTNSTGKPRQQQQVYDHERASYNSGSSGGQQQRFNPQEEQQSSHLIRYPQQQQHSFIPPPHVDYDVEYRGHYQHQQVPLYKPHQQQFHSNVPVQRQPPPSQSYDVDVGGNYSYRGQGGVGGGNFKQKSMPQEHSINHQELRRRMQPNYYETSDAPEEAYMVGYDRRSYSHLQNQPNSNRLPYQQPQPQQQQQQQHQQTLGVNKRGSHSDAVDESSRPPDPYFVNSSFDDDVVSYPPPKPKQRNSSSTYDPHQRQHPQSTNDDYNYYDGIAERRLQRSYNG